MGADPGGEVGVMRPGAGLLLVASLFAIGVAPVAAQIPFTEEAQLRGVSYVTGQDNYFGEGMAFVDLDDDGDPDLVLLGRADGLVGVYENNGSGFFTTRSATSGIPAVPHSTGVIAADYDRDGDLDLFISQGYDTLNKPGSVTPNVLVRNDGGFQFTDVTAEAGVGDAGPAYGCAWGDYDGDGLLDLYVSNRFMPNLLYHNLDNGMFEEVAKTLGVDRGDDPTFQSAFFDFDHDGDADLYVANDKAYCTLYSNHLFENVGGSFVDITGASGTEACVSSMCIAIGDFNDNGHQDLYVTNLAPGNALLINQGDGTFKHEEEPANVASYAIGWGSVFFDYDNDGHLDLYVCNILANNRLYRHDGLWPCDDLSGLLGVDDAQNSYTVAVADIDNDGDLDMAVQNTDEPVHLYVNHEGELRRWVKFDVRGEGESRYAVGANVRVCAGGVWRLREVIAGCNYLAQNDLTVHVGMDQAQVIDELQVDWPGGQSRTLTNLATNQAWTLYPPDKLGDADADGTVDLTDYFVFAGCFAGGFQPGCEMMDFDGNSAIDLLDYDAFIAVYADPLYDCNANKQDDLLEMLLDPGVDSDGTGVPDSCEAAGDLDGDGRVGITDFLTLLATWGPCPNPGACPADLDDDGIVGITDFLLLLGNWSL